LLISGYLFALLIFTIQDDPFAFFKHFIPPFFLFCSYVATEDLYLSLSYYSCRILVPSSLRPNMLL
jgi:hypothetical protein